MVGFDFGIKPAVMLVIPPRPDALINQQTGDEPPVVTCTSLFGTDLHFTLALVAPCPGATLTGLNISGTLVYGGGAWSASVGTATFTGGLSGAGTLLVGCDGQTFAAGVNYDGTLAGYNSFTGDSGTLLPDTIPNTNTCASFELGFGGTLTITL